MVKQRVKAGMLALVLGTVGAHQFYLGRWVWGMVYVLFCWTGVPTVLGVVEGLNFLLMSDQRFATKIQPQQVLMGAGGVTVATPETHVKCPDCRELVFKDARKCKHCGCALVPQA